MSSAFSRLHAAAHLVIAVAAVIVSSGLVARFASAQVIDPFYAADYSFVDLGSVPNVPANYGGITFLNGDPNTILIGGAANTLNADIYSASVTRDAMGHITSIGAATFFSEANGAAGGIDGGLTYGPGGVLFYTSYSDNRIGQIEPGSVAPDKLIDLTPLGVAPSVGAMMFVPPGFAGAGRLKITSYNGGGWYDTTISSDGLGTYDINPVGAPIAIGGGPEGIVYISDTNPGFLVPSILVSEYGLGRISSYEIDVNGDPSVATRRTFMTGLTGAEGATIDPVTGDFLFSTFGGGSHVIRISGFVPPIPEPASALLALAAIGALAIYGRGRRS